MIDIKAGGTQLIIGALITIFFPFYLSASSYLECLGVITLENIYPKDKMKKVVPNGKERFIFSDILIHDHTFNCKGHSASMPTGSIKKVKLILTPNIDISPKQGLHYTVKYKYFDSMTPRGYQSDFSWILIRRESTVPYKKQVEKQRSPEELDQSSGKVATMDGSVVKKLIKSLGSVSTQSVLEKGVKRYNGNYFSVDYPADFLVSPSGPIKSFRTDVHLDEFEKKPNIDPMESYYYIDTDEVYLSPPNDSVEFFVYSPQWSGLPLNYLQAQKNESIVSHENKKTTKSGVHYGFVQTRRMTFRAKDNSYKRSFVHQRACHSNKLENCISHVFGIKYKDRQAYGKYRDSYIAFKKSLKQFAD